MSSLECHVNQGIETVHTERLVIRMHFFASAWGLLSPKLSLKYIYQSVIIRLAFEHTFLGVSR